MHHPSPQGKNNVSQFESEKKVFQGTPVSYAFIALANQEATPHSHTIVWMLHVAHVVKDFTI